MPSTRTLFWTPTAQDVDDAPDTKFRQWVNRRHNLKLRNYDELHAWSISALDAFWTAVYDYCGVIGERTDPSTFFDASKPMETINRQLIRANMNYAENMLLGHANARSNKRAVLAFVEPKSMSSNDLNDCLMRSLTFEELYQQVRFVAHTLRTKFDIKPGDRVATFSPSNAEAVVLCLATLAIGGVWSSCPSEFGVTAVLERLEQIEPKVLLTADFYKYNGKNFPVYPKLEEILAKLPSVKNVVVVGQLSHDREPQVEYPADKQGKTWMWWNEMVRLGKGAPAEIQFERVSAMDPVWILYSSGTTGKPKAIVHSVGGMVLGQKMVQNLHNATTSEDTQLTFTTLGWMMWNHMLSVLGCGACMAAFDGSPFSPSSSTIWALAEKHKITILGLSPRYLQTLETNGYVPNKEYDLRHVKQVQTAGSVLKPELYDWMRLNIHKDVWVNNGTGGTDICSLFIGAVRSKPIYHGELTCMALGMDLQAWDEDGNPVIDGQGDMVITKPFPNMPIGFWGPGGEKRYHAAYFEAYPQKQPAVWTHGDWIEIHSLTKGVLVLGRSDGVLNPAGVRFGSAEIYNVVEEIEEVEDCLAIGQKLLDGDERFILFVKPKQTPLGQSVTDKIKLAIRTSLSPRHVPAKIIELVKIPYTTNGKRLEVPAKKLVNGHDYAKLNLSSAEDPECLKVFVDHPELRLVDVPENDEEFQDFEYDDENAYDSDLYIDDDDRQSQQAQASTSTRNRPQEPAPVRRYQPPPAPLAGNDDSDDDGAGAGVGGFGGMRGMGGAYAAAAGGGGGGIGRFLNPNAFQAGFGGHAFARPPASAFRRQYRAYSTAILEVQQGRSYGGGRSNLMYGGKIVMPPSALDELTQLDIELPIDFEITNPAQPELNTHAGVLEFIAEEGCVNLPQWIMDQLRLNEGDPIRIVGGRYPKGKLIKIQPQSVDFLEISDPKAVLEQALRNYSCLSAGDIVEIGYHSLTFRLLIMEITPPGPAISVLDTDLEVDFAPPVGYVEPEYKKPSESLPSMRDKFNVDTKGVQDVDARGSGTATPVSVGSKGKGKETDEAPAASWEAFKGTGNSLGGKRVKGKGVKAKAIEQVDENSRIFRTDQPRIVTADTQLGSRQVPAALNLPFGALFFGFDLPNARPPPGSVAEAAVKAKAEEASRSAAAPFANLTGSGATLSGRAARNAASAPAGAAANGGQTTGRASSAQPEQKPTVPFSGSGNTLSGKKPVEVIEID
ncbi:hypothetical protein JCM10296v2_001726 [Rhodotorula toruloides]